MLINPKMTIRKLINNINRDEQKAEVIQLVSLGPKRTKSIYDISNKEYEIEIKRIEIDEFSSRDEPPTGWRYITLEEALSAYLQGNDVLKVDSSWHHAIIGTAEPRRMEDYNFWAGCPLLEHKTKPHKGFCIEGKSLWIGWNYFLNFDDMADRSILLARNI